MHDEVFGLYGAGSKFITEAEIEKSKLATSIFDKVDAHQYSQVDVLLDIADIVIPEHTVRSVTDRDREVLVHLYDTTGILDSSGKMTVTFDGPYNQQERVKDGVINGKMVLLDGVTRYTALRFPRDNKGGKWISLCKSLKVSLWMRLDHKEMSPSENIGIGVLLNEVSSSVRKMTFADRVHSIVSLVLHAVEKNMVQLSTLNSVQLASELSASQSIGDLDKRQLKRYADFDLPLVREPQMHS